MKMKGTIQKTIRMDADLFLRIARFGESSELKSENTIYTLLLQMGVEAAEKAKKKVLPISAPTEKPKKEEHIEKKKADIEAPIEPHIEAPIEAPIKDTMTFPSFKNLEF